MPTNNPLELETEVSPYTSYSTTIQEPKFLRNSRHPSNEKYISKFSILSQLSVILKMHDMIHYAPTLCFYAHFKPKIGFTCTMIWVIGTKFENRLYTCTMFRVIGIKLHLKPRKVFEAYFFVLSHCTNKR